MADRTPRVWWKGAITFGLVHIPVALHSATNETGIDFDWLDEMTTHWDPSQFRDTFTEEVMKPVEQKIEAGQTETVIQPAAQEAGIAASDVVDLTELLQRSLQGRKEAKPSGGTPGSTKRKSARRSKAGLKGSG